MKANPQQTKMKKQISTLQAIVSHQSHILEIVGKDLEQQRWQIVDLNSQIALLKGQGKKK
jgi:hypothetical protein